jgi:hypothetical protein
LGKLGEAVCRLFHHFVEGTSPLPFFHEEKIDAYVNADIALMVKELSSLDA